MISYHLLWSLLRIGEDLESVHDTTGERIAVRLDSWQYVQEAIGHALVMSCHYYQWAGTCYHRVPITRKVRDFSNLRKVEEYSGFFFTRAFSGVSRLMGEGQVVVDVKGYRRCNPSLDTWSEDTGKTDRHAQWASSASQVTQPCQELSSDQLHLLPPSIHGFSFRAKRWGELLVSRLSPIRWGTESFAHLVIPDSYRRIVKALVTVHAGELKNKLMIDVVAGKGNGLVMAFHGPPGTGKTLTAEAIAEHLRRPLYVVSAGELGILPQVLETQLRDILEADIFLQKRDASHLERNALVGVFLRLLLLTTNSIKSCPARFDLDHLADFSLNGREIKHAVQTAQAIALMEDEELEMKHIEEVCRYEP
ncbi:hypothetical protein BMF94_2775 [Rhodotorula taiwanensis]|uniref:AAA+ ATPase domain-containing protein n=1 Tax=Rhodotorula taiwanensis TaxID=741276 RepID=A0A2S5BBT5_9BASI|nr:hypothetical protein BMF94_2775 [Rhodotorula taiwanensis]